MEIFDFIIFYALIGLITGFIYKKLFPWEGTTSLGTYLIMGVISGLICGLGTHWLLVYGYFVSQTQGTTPGYANPGQAGNPSIGFDNSGLWLTPLVAIIGTLLIMTIYRSITRYRHPE